LHRAWRAELAMYGKEDLLDRIKDLPLRGEIPKGAADADARIFSSLEGDPGTILTFPVDVGGVSSPVRFFVLPGPRGFDELQDQFRWVAQIRGGRVPDDVQAEISKLNATAVETKADFRDVCDQAFGLSGKGKKATDR